MNVEKLIEILHTFPSDALVVTRVGFMMYENVFDVEQIFVIENLRTKPEHADYVRHATKGKIAASLISVDLLPAL